ncbi:MAP3K7 C-terminal-like protein isoform 1-T3 [Ara ararauna]
MWSGVHISNHMAGLGSCYSQLPTPSSFFTFRTRQHCHESRLAEGAMAGSKQLEQTSKSIDSSAHMITTARVPADKPVRIAFSLNESPDDASSENFPLTFPELDQQLQPLPPCHDSKESMQVYKQHCKIAEEYHEVKKEIALLEERKKELIARLEQVEKESMDAAQLAKEYAELTEENRTLKLAQTQCVEQLEKLRIQYQKRQGSS